MRKFERFSVDMKTDLIPFLSLSGTIRIDLWN